METIILPGDKIPFEIEEDPNPLLIGPGLFTSPSSDKIIPINAGFFNNGKKKRKTFLYIESNLKRYIPSVGDFVIGSITGTFSDFFRVNLSNYTSSVHLSTMSFPNASKKNRPNLKIGSIVYARVSSVDPDIETELECIDPTTGKDGGFGPLEGGYVFDVNLAFARALLFHNSESSDTMQVITDVLEVLADKSKYEIAIGVNGRIWVKAEEVKTELAVSMAIQKAQSWTKEDIQPGIQEIWSKLKI